MWTRPDEAETLEADLTTTKRRGRKPASQPASQSNGQPDGQTSPSPASTRSDAARRRTFVHLLALGALREAAKQNG